MSNSLLKIGISSQWVITADRKVEILDGKCIVDPDLRGRHSNRPCRVSEEVKNLAREHIKSFPTTESDQCFMVKPKKFLMKGLSASKMFKMYNYINVPRNSTC